MAKLDIVRAYWQAERDGKLSDIMAHYSPNAEFVTPSGVVKGTEAIRAAYQQSLTTYREIIVTIVNATEAENQVAAEYSLELIWPDGASIITRGCNVFTFEGERFASVRCYFDPAAFLKPS